MSIWNGRRRCQDRDGTIFEDGTVFEEIMADNISELLKDPNPQI